MSDQHQVLFGLTLILIFSILVIGSITLALLEGNETVAFALSPTSTYREHAFPTFINIIPGQSSDTPSPMKTSIDTQSKTPTITPKCPLPEGWIEIILQPGDTIDALAAQFGIERATIIDMNCLVSDTLIEGASFFVPGPPYRGTLTATPTDMFTNTPQPTPFPTRFPVITKPSVLCGPPPNWVIYRVRPGDTLFRLSQALDVSIYWLQYANCLRTSTNIVVGQQLWVPFLPPPPTQKPIPYTNTPTMTATATCEYPPTLTNTPTDQTNPSSTMTLPPTDTLGVTPESP
jgi:LysM repeat protein